MRVITNNHEREVIYAYELTEAERKEFDYLDWSAIEKGEDSATFVRYKRELYDLAEFERLPIYHDEKWKGWDGYQSDTFFSGILVRWAADHDYVIMGRYYT